MTSHGATSIIFFLAFSRFFRKKTCHFEKSEPGTLQGEAPWGPINISQSLLSLGASEKIWAKKNLETEHHDLSSPASSNSNLWWKIKSRIQHFLVKIHWKLRLAIWSHLGYIFEPSHPLAPSRYPPQLGLFVAKKTVVTRRRCWVGNTNIAGPEEKLILQFSVQYSFKADFYKLIFKSWLSS